MRHLRCILLSLCVLAVSARAADPAAEITSFSEFKKIDVPSLVGGQIMAERGAPMNFPRGISVQTCFIADCPAKDAARFLPEWDASPHPELKIYMLGFFKETDKTTFERLAFDPEKKPMRRLVERTLEANPDKADIQLSFNEFAQLQKCLTDAGIKGTSSTGKNELEAAKRFWDGFLANRWQQFQQGGFEALSPYDASRAKYVVNSEIQSLLADEQKIVKRFEEFLVKTPFLSKSSPPPKPVINYWALSDVQGTANISMGAFYAEAFPDHWKMADVTYYASSDYFTSMVLYELWPVTVDGRESTLVWRLDMVSAPKLAFTKGVDQMVYGGVLLQEVKKVVRAFQKDAAKQRGK